jgi:hypothetical protein
MSTPEREPLRIVGYDPETLGTVEGNPSRLLVDWLLSRPLTDFERWVMENVSDDERVTPRHHGSRHVPAVTTPQGVEEQAKTLNARLLPIEEAAARLEERHTVTISEAKESLERIAFELFD